MGFSWKQEDRGRTVEEVVVEVIKFIADGGTLGSQLHFRGREQKELLFPDSRERVNSCRVGGFCPDIVCDIELRGEIRRLYIEVTTGYPQGAAIRRKLCQIKLGKKKEPDSYFVLFVEPDPEHLIDPYRAFRSVVGVLKQTIGNLFPQELSVINPAYNPDFDLPDFYGIAQDNVDAFNRGRKSRKAARRHLQPSPA